VREPIAKEVGQSQMQRSSDRFHAPWFSFFRAESQRLRSHSVSVLEEGVGRPGEDGPLHCATLTALSDHLSFDAHQGDNTHLSVIELG
jgi:hypothetical protein